MGLWTDSGAKKFALLGCFSILSIRGCALLLASALESRVSSEEVDRREEESLLSLYPYLFLRVNLSWGGNGGRKFSGLRIAGSGQRAATLRVMPSYCPRILDNAECLQIQ